MKIENAIGWCDETTNAVTGCDKVSAGCKNCYAATGTRARVLRGQGIETWGANGVRQPVNFAPKIRALNKKCVCNGCRLSHPIKFLNFKPEANSGEQVQCGCNGKGPGTLRRIRLFADSNSDWLDDKWPIETLADFLNEIRLAPNVDVQLLTKRPENFSRRIESVRRLWACDGSMNQTDEQKTYHWLCRWIELGEIPKNIWLGVSVENQAMADQRIPEILKIPAAVRFLSCEPLLEDIDIQSAFGINEGCGGESAKECCEECGWLTRKVDWVIVGGESGKDRRDCGIEAIENVADQCVSAEVPVYVKQDCSFFSGEQGRIPNDIWKLKQFPKRF